MANISLSPGVFILLVRIRLYLFGCWMGLKARECHLRWRISGIIKVACVCIEVRECDTSI